LDLEILEEKLINLIELAILEKKVELEEITLRAMFLSTGGCNKYIQIVLHKMAVLRA
jgi:hypothetical protein